MASYTNTSIFSSDFTPFSGSGNRLGGNEVGSSRNAPYWNSSPFEEEKGPSGYEAQKRAAYSNFFISEPEKK